ncbi:MAG: UDP-N-acetylglucosamine 2-epimerase (non-hydrolyzing) [Candidatus Dojkabacteria bacterium]|nr:UDP-N-acetylglucosamine 2-epimerase (non-hydrolyzing) [Candidatus Dojkabacteria bacterium]MDD4561053.1 UDP-N-acetylglucosamine 2-epimerase (non-hydrolyzing) [Candidatus Dojkabacteria bacterium]
MKVVSLIGARPQFIKEAVLNKEFKKQGVEEIIVNSGQHYDYNMADIFFETLGIKSPDYNLEVGSGLHGEMTGKIMTEFEKLVVKIKPDVILVYGDTNTTLAGSLVGAKLKVKVAHVEAGIRMLPKDMPEEINRVLTDRISTYLFCPTEDSLGNLKHEGITEGVHFTGDVTYDLYLQMKEKFDYSVFKELNLEEGKYSVVTVHRDYNVDNEETLKEILEALNEVNKASKVVFPMHPRTKKMIEKFGYEEFIKDLMIFEPIDYLSLMALIEKSKNVITDSGGLQRESYYAKKPAFLLMPDPAWHELVEERMNFLCTPGNLVESIEKEKIYNYVPYIQGKGDAGERIVKILRKE